MEATAYPDSSFLVSLVCQDSKSEEAAAYMKKSAQALIFTPLHRVECRNALRNASARGALTAAELRTAFRQIEEDLSEGLLVHAQVEWTNALRRADELSDKHAATDGQRTIDLIHIALALECKAKTFLSFDLRQRKLAQAVRLKVKP